MVRLGGIGVWTSYRPFGIERAGEAAKLVEQLGYSTWWVGGSPHVPDIRRACQTASGGLTSGVQGDDVSRGARAGFATDAVRCLNGVRIG